jgi:hypothetical protein
VTVASSVLQIVVRGAALTFAAGRSISITIVQVS